MVTPHNRADPSDYLHIAHTVLRQWRRWGRPVAGAFVQGSTARNGYVAHGSDLDLRIVVPDEPRPHWFEERIYGPYVVETFPLALAEVRHDEQVLTSPSLAVALHESVIFDDPDNVLHALRTRIAPNLCDPAYILRRVTICFTDADAAWQQARAALLRGDRDEACHAFAAGIWSSLAMVPILACQSPTARRAFVLVRQAAARWQREDLNEMALRLLGSARLTAEEGRRLAGICGAMSPRYREGPLAMIDVGEVEEVAWPLLYGALWGGGGRRLPTAQQYEIFSALEIETGEEIGERLRVAEALSTALLQIAHTVYGHVRSPR